ncbi:response regulator [Lacrimispora sp.]|uniref:response regulator transcription factor n=1 Tax=Lacrimispora sp. TaxID=2719234 RepID=UPI0029E721FC|nr:two-component system, response regulator YesN [Lacrimispora sp.]
MSPISMITLLIVDDEAEIRSGLRSIIPWEDYSITLIGTAANGAEALDKIRYYEPDIVITDIQMPGMSGLELVRRAREEQFDCSFVILTGYDEFEYARTAIRYGVREYLLKPISIKDLTELIQNLKEDILSKRDYHSDQLSTLRKLRKAQVSLRKQNLIPQLLRGELSATELHKVIQEYNLPIQDKESCAVLIQAFSTFQYTEETAELANTLVPMREALEKEINGLPALISDYPPAGLVLVVNLPFQSDRWCSLRELLEHHIRITNTGGAACVTAAIGKPVPSLCSIAASFQESRQIITWHIYPQTGPVLDSAVLDPRQPSVIMPGDDLLEAVLKDDREGIQNCFQLYLDKLTASVLPPPSYLYSMCNYVIITLQSQLSRYLDGPPKSYSGNSFAALQSLNSLEDIKYFMVKILSGFAEELTVSQAAKNDPLIQKALDYINKNLLKNPRTEDVCNYLGLSKSYFSTYFKNKTQLNFRDYTLDLKINYAQEQLKFQEHTSGEVSLLLGYEDYRSFSRAFKARTGLTPSEYQKQFAAGERSTS